MDLKDFFATQCRKLAVDLHTFSPSIKKMVPARKKDVIAGVMGILDFEDFKINISYTEQGNFSYAQQTIWVSFSLDCDEGIPYSLYDILAFTDPQNFNCYTYTYVDSQKLMEKCFGELKALLKTTVPTLKELLSNGITKNKIITTQKENINGYFGDNVLESSDMIGGAADKIIAMMLNNFYESEIEAAIVGTQSFFYNGNHEKALKKLKKAKRKTYYQKNLLTYLENGGKNESVSEVVKEASSKKGIKRQSGGLKEALKIILYLLLFMIPVSLCLVIIFLLLCAVIFRGNIFVSGIIDNLILIPFTALPLSFCFSLNYIIKKEESKKKVSPDDIHIPKYPVTLKKFIKYFTIAAESIAIIICTTSVLSCTAFYKEHFSYADTDFPTSQETCEYTAVDSINIIEGFNYAENEFREEKYIVIKTKSGQIIDLYNSTWFSYEDFLSHEEFFEEKGIKINTYKTIESLKDNKTVDE